MKKKNLLSLYAIMFRIGLVSFGGGWGVMAQMEEEFVEQRGWMTKETVIDYMSLARSFPGIMIINYCIMCGYNMMGIPGAIVAAFGLSSPAILVLSVVTFCYDKVIDNPMVARAMIGVRCAVIPITFKAALKMVNSAVKHKVGLALALISLGICLFTKFEKLIMIILGAIFGLVYFGVFRKGEEESV